MIKKVKISRSHILERLHFKEASFNKINLLFGGNGSGKSTLLHLIEEGVIRDSDEVIKDPKKKYTIHKYYNSKDNERLNNPNPYTSDSSGYATSLARKVHANSVSEGQSIIYSFSAWLDTVMKDIQDDRYHIILLDEIDSGLSCDHVNVVLHLLNNELFEKDNVQLFIASNMYHWVFAMKKVFSMYDGDFIKISNYAEYFQIQMDKQRDVGKKSDFNFL